eukprot:1856307-Pleurochrysis_carterae.AAC.1
MRGVISKIVGVVMCVVTIGTDIRKAGIQAVDVRVNMTRRLITRGVYSAAPLAAAIVRVVRREAAVAIVTA